MSKADAPSLIELEFAAVIVPSFANAALNVGILSILAFAGFSSTSIVTSPFRVVTFTAVISFLKYPSAMAFCARVRERIANSSICSRL